MLAVRRCAALVASVVVLLASQHVRHCDGAATWSVSVATGFTSVDYSTPLSTSNNNAQDANWMVDPPGSAMSQPARITAPGSNDWPPGGDWVANGLLSNWVAVSANDYRLGNGGPYNFTRSFHVPAAVMAATVVLSGAISCDNDCNMLINGARVGTYYRSNYASLTAFSINLGAVIRPGQLNHLRINLTDRGGENGMRIQGAITGQLSNYWSVNVASGFTSRDYSGPLSTVNAQKDAHWTAKRPAWPQPQAAEICMRGGGNYPDTNSWVANGPNSAWIAVSCTAYAPGQGGPYDFLYNFTFPVGVDPLSITFVGHVACDDHCNLLINNQNVGPSYTSAYTVLRYFTYDYSAGWNVGGVNTIRINFTDTASANGVRIEGTIQARMRMSSSTGSPAKLILCPYWADGRYEPKCSCPYPSEGVYPYCECPAPYRGDIPYDCPSLYPDPNDPDWGKSTGAAGGSSDSSGLSPTIIVVIVLAVVLVALAAAYGYHKYFRQPAAGGEGGSWSDKPTLLSGHTDSAQQQRGQQAMAPQGGLDYYMTAPTNTQPTAAM